MGDPGPSAFRRCLQPGQYTKREYFNFFKNFTNHLDPEKCFKQYKLNTKMTKILAQILRKYIKDNINTKNPNFENSEMVSPNPHETK